MGQTITHEQRKAWRDSQGVPWMRLRARLRLCLDALETVEAQRDALLRVTLYSAQERAAELEDDEYELPNPGDWLEYAMQKDAPWNAVCRICGCSWFNPCPGGCSWVEPNLCSTCARKN